MAGRGRLDGLAWRVRACTDHPGRGAAPRERRGRGGGGDLRAPVPSGPQLRAVPDRLPGGEGAARALRRAGAPPCGPVPLRRGHQADRSGHPDPRHGSCRGRHRGDRAGGRGGRGLAPERALVRQGRVASWLARAPATGRTSAPREAGRARSRACPTRAQDKGKRRLRGQATGAQQDPVTPRERGRDGPRPGQIVPGASLLRPSRDQDTKGERGRCSPSQQGSRDA